jgi:hypothetical protein
MAAAIIDALTPAPVIARHAVALFPVIVLAITIVVAIAIVLAGAIIVVMALLLLPVIIAVGLGVGGANAGQKRESGRGDKKSFHRGSPERLTGATMASPYELWLSAQKRRRFLVFGAILHFI